MKARNGIMAALCLAGIAVSSANAATNDVTTDITVNTTWSSADVHVLHDPIYVTGGATLTIQPGTLIRGTLSTGTNDAPGALIVSRDGTIMANGSATQPIVFTDMNDDHFVGPTPSAGTAPYDQPNNFIAGNWGGVIILGDTYIAHNDSEVQIEGLEPAGAKSTYGGSDDNDDRGDLTFVSIRHGGYVIGLSNEINGLTMGAVGRGTKIQNIEVYQSLDDGYEWFGGTVDTKYLVSWSVGDDMFDWDEGFRGRGQFWLGVKGLSYNTDAGAYDVTDHAAEMDGAGKSDANMPASSPTIYNATLVGHGPDSTHSGRGGLKDLCWLFRDGTGARWVNSMVIDFGGALALIEGNLTDGKTYNPSYKTQQMYVRDASYTHMVEGMAKLDIQNSVFWGVEYPDAKAATNGVTTGWFSAKGYWGGDDDKDHLGAENGFSLLDGPKMNVAIDRTWEANPPIYGLVRAASATDGIYPIEYLDPTLLDQRYMNAKVQPSASAKDSSKFFSPVAFQGAFAGRNWAAWTYVAKLGLIPDDNYGVYEGNFGTGAVNSMQIVQNGNLVSFVLEPGVHEGYVSDITIAYYNGANWYGYNWDTEAWVVNSVYIKTMPLRSLNLQDILDVSTLPSGTEINFVIDQTPDGQFSGNPRFGWEKLTL